jgi:hypothetical protein
MKNTFEKTAVNVCISFIKKPVVCAIILALAFCISIELINLSFADPVSDRETVQAKKIDRLM